MLGAAREGFTNQEDTVEATIIDFMLLLMLSVRYVMGKRKKNNLT
jgi:hypothetical protein